ncbi:hypothetical protein C8J55DRAFT_523149 [Lentinula edodes]|uniref:Uncharacterized protein n=1 Tax=Lentinula lateritia TaxID=40482 RepID=A0A9W9DHR2_9AGAR|nr:hypothetical protein C8J55DRAFT_523149 [Lentinula edodes]
MKEEHPLQYSWTLYHDSKAKFPYTPAPTSANPTGAAPPLVPRDRDHSTTSAASTSNSPTAASIPTSSTSTNTSANPTDPSQPQSQNPFSHAPGDYEANLTVIGSFTTSPIKPMWEEPANASGGKWVLTMRDNPELLDRCWGWLCMALVGEELERYWNSRYWRLYPCGSDCPAFERWYGAICFGVPLGSAGWRRRG